MSRACPHRWPDGWRIAEAIGHRSRARGLLGRDGLAGDEGLWLPVRSIHTVGMRFAIDVVWLDRHGLPLRIDARVVPGRLRSCRRARGGVVEVAAGRGASAARALASLVGVSVLGPATGGAVHQQAAHPDHECHAAGGHEVGSEGGEGHRTIVRAVVCRMGPGAFPGAGRLP